MKFEFVKDYCERCDEFGLKLLGSPFAEPIHPLGAAHDILEHFPNDTGSVYDEIQAFGASIHVRGEYYLRLVNSKLSYAENWSYALDDVRSYVEHNNLEMPDFYSDGLISTPYSLSSVKDDYIEEIIERTAKSIYWSYDDEYERRRKSLSQEQLDLVHINLKNLLSSGYIRAKKRYLNKHNHELAHFFHELVFLLERNYKYIEPHEKIVVSIKFSTLESNVKIKFYEP